MSATANETRTRKVEAGFFSSAKSFQLLPGRHVSRTGLRGYYIDLSIKAEAAVWPPAWFPQPKAHLFIEAGQWGLGAFERYLEKGDERWLAAAVAVGDVLVARQEREGVRAGAWVENRDYPHTFHMRGPWISAMSQGQCASLLARLHLETGRDDFAETAARALLPLRRRSSDGGAAALLDGDLFPEEYPTDPPSFVLNGGIFALWGYLDVGRALDDRDARQAFEEGVEALSRNIRRWDTGGWSRYDLYPHPVRNVASSAYHALHISQLLALEIVAPRRELRAARVRFEEYARSAPRRRIAFAQKVAFRLVVPRNAFLATRMPWKEARGHA